MKKTNTFSVKFSTPKIMEIKFILENQGFSFSDQQYSFFKAQKSNVTVIPYNKGKLVIQGPDSEIYYNLLLENHLINVAQIAVKKTIDEKIDINEEGIGIDESGKGDFFGPLVVCACYVNEKNGKILTEYNIRDSKKISKKKIIEYANIIKSICEFEVVEIGPEKYNKLYDGFNNLNKMLAWAHSRSAENLLIKLEKKGIECQSVISDQFAGKQVLESFLMEKTKKINFKQFHKAERVMSVAAASIVARDHFVQKMEFMSRKFGIEFPLGCSDITKYTAREFVNNNGIEMLASVCKKHFKTYQQVTGKV